MKYIQTYKIFFAFIFITTFSSCYIYHSQQPALIHHVDIDQTILVARDEIKKKNDMAQSLCIWILRDQIITAQHAKIISDMYLAHIDSMTTPFNIWHASWAISNLYRLGNADVKTELETAYKKAITQTSRIDDSDDFKDAAEDHINGKKLTTGFIHLGGLYYAYGHLVVPGNEDYIQSYEEYLYNEWNKSQ